MNGHFSWHRLRRTLLLAALVALAVCSTNSAHAALSPDEQQLLSHVDASRMMHTIRHLCSDTFAGRRAGSPEHYAVADYLASRLEICGLSAVDGPGMEGFKQPLTMRYALVKSKNDIKARLTYTPVSGGSQTPRVETFDYCKYNGNGGLDLSSELVFIGHGIHDPEAGYDDYRGLDVSGKIVMWLPGEPRGAKLSKQHTGARKLLAAYQHGAMACIMFKPAEVKDEWGTNVGLAGPIADFPYLAVDKEIAKEMFSTSANTDLSKLRPGEVGVELRLRITQICDPQRKTNNVVGMLPGADPAFADEVVVVGAHYDHLGSAAGAGIFRGADDNASGTSVVLEVARAICALGLHPKRTIVFGLWTGEEAGLIGSNYFAANPPLPLKSIVSNLQLDMVGRGTPGSFFTTGASAYPDHYSNLASGASDLGMTLTADVVTGASDHLAFVRKRVPTSLVYAAGEHPDYHTVRDTAANIEPKVVESAARLTALAVWRAANSGEKQTSMNDPAIEWVQ